MLRGKSSVSSYSEAFFGAGTKLTVLEPRLNVTEPVVEMLPPSAKECKDREKKMKKTLVCVASGFYPDHVTVSWYVDGQLITDGVASDHSALRTGKTYRITSRLRVASRKWHTSAKFNCTVSFFNGRVTSYHWATVDGDPSVQLEGMTREQFVKVTQAAKLSYVVFIVKNVVYGLFVTILAWKLGLGWPHATAKQ